MPTGPGAAAARSVPDGGRPYPQLLRTPGMPRWRPLVSLLLGVCIGFWLLICAGVLVAALASVSGSRLPAGFGETGVTGFLLNNLVLAAGIPTAMVAVGTGFLRPPGWLASVEGRFRWRWLAVVLLPVVVWAVLVAGLWLLLEGAPGTGGHHIAVLLAVCLVTTPLQAAGEEYLIRGWLSQSVGAWFGGPRRAAWVAAVLSAVVFALLHGQQDPWLFVDRFGFGLAASYLAWRTGGIESGIVLHAVNNVAAIVPAVLAGTLDASLTVQQASGTDVLVDLGSLAPVLLVIIWLARRQGVARRGQPELGGPGSPVNLPSSAAPALEG